MFFDDYLQEKNQIHSFNTSETKEFGEGKNFLPKSD